jgi:hypothetical protein
MTNNQQYSNINIPKNINNLNKSFNANINQYNNKNSLNN